MKIGGADISLVQASDVLPKLGLWIRHERQREELTQGELAAKSNVPATTISRLERTGLVSSESFLRILFALDRIDAFDEFLAERIRLAKFPKSLAGVAEERVVMRVRHRKEPAK